MHGKYSSLDSIAVMNTNLSGQGPWYVLFDLLKVGVPYQALEEMRGLICDPLEAHARLYDAVEM